MARIVIIGGGITGLSAAFDLAKQDRHQVSLLERSNRLGGKIITHYPQGLIVERSADSIFTAKPWAVELMAELGLKDELVEPIGGGFSMLVDGKVHRVPRALGSLMPIDPVDLELVAFWDEVDRSRILAEEFVPKGSGEDETVASFFRRRFGDRFSKTLAEPLLAGIQAGSPEVLSMKALYPAYVNLEQKHGSLISAAKSAVRSRAGSPSRPGFLTLRGGLQRLIDTLVEHIRGVDIRLDYVTEGIECTPEGAYGILGPQPIEADAVILAIPAFAAAPLIANLAPAASEGLSQIRHASTAVVTLGYRADAFGQKPKGNGFLVPAGEQVEITGCTFSSLKWQDRAPDGTLLLRAFMGQDAGANVDDFADEMLLEKAQASIAKVLDATTAPFYKHVDRWTNAMPQYDIGHSDRMDRIEAAVEAMPIVFAGASYRGTGIPDCIRQGREAARKVLGLNI